MYLNAKIFKILPWWQNLRWVLNHIYKFIIQLNPSPTEKFAFVIFLSFFVTQADGSGGGSIVGALDKIWTSLLELKWWIKLRPYKVFLCI